MKGRGRLAKKRVIWGITAFILIIVVGITAVGLFTEPRVEVQADRMMKKHGFQMIQLETVDTDLHTGAVTFTDYRAEGIDEQSLEQLARDLESLLISTGPVTNNSSDGTISLSYDPQKSDDGMVVTIVPEDKIDGEWKTVKAVVVSRKHVVLSPWQRLVDLLPF